MMTLGSLFDGSGGFPLAGKMHGIRPVWASEIEPFPLRVTAARLPEMKQLGDITKIDGSKIEPVDIVTFGSPCQDLSIAGKQKGIHEGERSNLFFEAVRIIREMRNATADKFPRFAVWENVPGAFSSNGGEISGRSSKHSAALPVRTDYQFLDLRNGLMPDVWSEQDGLSPGGSTTLNTGESPSDARGSTLSQILEANAPEKFCLSAKACQGILNRAERRGKVLPTMLREALEEVISLSRNARENLGGARASSADMTGPSHSLPSASQSPTTAQSGENVIVERSVYGVDCRNAVLTKEKTHTVQAKPSGGTSLNCTPSVIYPIQNYAQDSRCEVKDPAEPCQTLNARMGTGGGAMCR